MSNALMGTIGKYNLREMLGNSGIGSTYRAEDVDSHREVAVKVLRSYFASETALMARFQAEVQAISRLAHPNILPIYECARDDNVSYVATAYVAGGSLKDRLHGPLSLLDAVGIATQIGAALDAAHKKGITHRNLKPSNVFLAADGTAFLSDFGMATLGEGVHPLMRTALTTPLPTYMSPEQAQGLPVDGRTDVYQMGVLLYELLTGELPFLGYTPLTIYAKQSAYSILTPSELNPAIPATVDRVILRAMSQLPAERFATAGDLAVALAAAVGENVPLGEPSAAAAPYQPLATGVSEPQHTETEVTLPEQPPERRTLLCLACATSNPEGGTVCASCGGSLATAPLVAAPEAGRWVRWRRRQRRIGRVAGGVLAALGSVVVIGGLTYVGLGRPPIPLPSPTTTISSISAPGEWRMMGNNATRSGYDIGGYPSPKGTIKWRFTTQEPIYSSPVVAGGKVYLAAGDRRIVALDAATGNLVWEHTVTGPVDSSPAVAGGLLFVGLRDHRILALDIDTGDRRWEYETGNPIIASPLVMDGILYIGSGDHKVYTFDAATGKKRWSAKTGGWVKASPAVDDGVAAFGSQDAKVYLLQAKNGRHRYFYSVSGGVSSGVTVVGRTAYVGSDNGRLYSLDTKQKERRGERGLRTVWTQFWLWNMAPTPPPARGVNWVFVLQTRAAISSTPAVGNGLVYFGAQDFNLYAVDAGSGEERWRFKTGGPVSSSPILANGLLYFGSSDGQIYAVDAKSGNKVWQIQTKGAVTSSPALAGGLLYIASQDGVLYAIE